MGLYMWDIAGPFECNLMYGFQLGTPSVVSYKGCSCKLSGGISLKGLVG